MIQIPTKYQTEERSFPTSIDPLMGIEPGHVARYQFARSFAKGKRVVDLMCGSGYGALIMACSSYLGVDVEPYCAGFAMRHIHPAAQSASFVTADVLGLPLDPMRAKLASSFDTVVCFEGIEHLASSDVDAFFGTFHWLLRNDGVALISTPLWKGHTVSSYHRYEFQSREEFAGAASRAFHDVHIMGQSGTAIGEFSPDCQHMIMIARSPH